jgi:hypothetical protein
MDPLSHLIFTGLLLGRKPGLLLAGVAPDLPFYLLYPAWLLKHKKQAHAGHEDLPLPSTAVQRLHYASHSLLILAGLLAIRRMIRLGPSAWALAWILHILLDIPSHARVRMAPRPLWPLSSWAFDGCSWADEAWHLLKGLSEAPEHGDRATTRQEMLRSSRLQADEHLEAAPRVAVAMSGCRQTVDGRSQSLDHRVPS